MKKGTALTVASKALSDLPLDDLAVADTANVEPISELKEAMFYKKLDGVMIECTLEPRGCIVNNWERGYCGAKENRDGKYYSLVHSRPSAVYVEPVETDHFYHVLPDSEFLGLGTAGCNLGCKFCETWNLSQVRPEETETQNLTPEEAIKLAQEKGCKIIDFTYNDPVIAYEYVLETSKLAKQNGLTTLCHTAGYIHAEPLQLLLENMDAINVDLKAFSEDYYSSVCSVEFEHVLNTLKVIKQKNIMLEITNLIVTGRNDDRENISDMVTWITDNIGNDTPLHFSRFFPNFQFTDLLATPEETLEMAHDIARSAGINYVYIDNLPGHDYQSTYCPTCKTKLVERNGTEVKLLDISSNGVCVLCDTKVPGIWT